MILGVFRVSVLSPLTSLLRRGRCCHGRLVLVVVCLACRPGFGQAPVPGPVDPGSGTSPRGHLTLDDWIGPAQKEPVAGRPGRFHLFRIPPGTAVAPLTDFPGGGASAAYPAAPPPCDEWSQILAERLQVEAGADNPFLDFRWPGDPGGVGFYKMSVQFAVLDRQPARLTLNLQAVAPAGPETDGAPEGPRTISPALGWSQDLGGGTFLQGFVGENWFDPVPRVDTLKRDVQYGVAMLWPLAERRTDRERNLYLFLETLGRLRYDGDPAPPAPPAWVVLPGLYWAVGDRCWVSGAVSMDLGKSDLGAGLWQVTCSCRF